MVDAHQNLNGSRDLTTPLSGMAYYPRLAIAADNLPAKFEASISTHNEDRKGDTKCRKLGDLRLLELPKVTENSTVRESA